MCGVFDFGQEKFKCKECGNSFCSKTDMKEHSRNVHVREFQTKILEYQQNLFKQNYKLTRSVNKLMEVEISQSYKSCNCKKFCRINHGKHNWRKYVSFELIEKIEEIRNCVSELSNDFEKQSGNCEAYHCSNCDEIFANNDDLNIHIETFHTENDLERAENREVREEDHFVQTGGMS